MMNVLPELFLFYFHEFTETLYFRRLHISPLRAPEIKLCHESGALY